MNKRQQKIYLRRLLECFGSWGRKQPPVHRLRAARKAVFFARNHGLEIPTELSALILVKLFSLLYERTCEVCRLAVIEGSVHVAEWNERPEDCCCAEQERIPEEEGRADVRGRLLQEQGTARPCEVQGVRPRRVARQGGEAGRAGTHGPVREVRKMLASQPPLPGMS